MSGERGKGKGEKFVSHEKNQSRVGIAHPTFKLGIKAKRSSKVPYHQPLPLPVLPGI